MPTKKTTAAKPKPKPQPEPEVEAHPLADEDPFMRAFFDMQPCTVHELAIAVSRPAQHCRVWLAEHAARGEIVKQGDGKWQFRS